VASFEKRWEPAARSALEGLAQFNTDLLHMKVHVIYFFYCFFLFFYFFFLFFCLGSVFREGRIFDAGVDEDQILKAGPSRKNDDKRPFSLSTPQP